MNILDNHNEALQKEYSDTSIEAEKEQNVEVDMNPGKGDSGVEENKKNFFVGKGIKSQEMPRKSLLIDPHFFMSVLFLIAYFGMLGSIIYIESSDVVNMQKGENSMMKELQILLGAITAGFVQILNYWFSNNGNNKK